MGQEEDKVGQEVEKVGQEEDNVGQEVEIVKEKVEQEKAMQEKEFDYVRTMLICKVLFYSIVYIFFILRHAKFLYSSINIVLLVNIY